MTLAQMAAFVCAKVRQQDATAILRCKEFLRRRYEMIYAEELWRASLYTHAFSLPNQTIRDYDPNITTTGEEGMFFMPALVDRVLAIRPEDAQLEVIDELQLYRGTLDQYAEEGDPVKFSILSPAIFWVAAPNLDNMPVRFGGLGTDETLTCRWIDGQGVRHTTEVDSTTGENAFGTVDEDGAMLIETVTKAETDAEITLEFDEGDVQGSGGIWDKVGRAGAEETSMVPRQRIRVYPKPGNGATALGYRALVKAKALPLTDDNDVPALMGIENCLMAFAQADMLERARQYGKAQLVQQGAQELLLDFKRLEVAQQANRQQITPEVTEPSGMIGWQRSKGFI